VTLLQKDTRIVGTPEYIKLGFAVFGPLDGETGAPSLEVLRSKAFSRGVRDLVEDIEEDGRPLDPGKYLVAVYNPTKTAGRSVNLVVDLDKGGEAVKNIVPTAVRRITPELRSSLALASAVGSKKSKRHASGPLETSGAFTPCGGYAYAARNLGKTEVHATFDFSRCRGYKIVGSSSLEATATLAPGGGMQLIAEFAPISEPNSFSASLKYSMVKQKSSRPHAALHGSSGSAVGPGADRRGRQPRAQHF